MVNTADYDTPLNGDKNNHGGESSASGGGGGVNHLTPPPQQNNDKNASPQNNNTNNPNTAASTQRTEEVEEEDESNDLLFTCQCDSARTIATLLSCLRRVITAGGNSSGQSNFTSSSHHHTQGNSTQRGTQSTSAANAVAGGSANKIQHATVYAGPNGLTFHVQHGLAKQSQCSVDMPAKGLFKEYWVGEEEVWLEDSDDDEEGTGNSQKTGTKEVIQGGEFGVNLTTVLECFSILSKTGTKPTMQNGGSGSSYTGGSKHLGEYASLSNVPLCMSYDRGTATFHLEFLEGGSLSKSTGGDAAASSHGCLVTCEIPGVAVADDVDDGPDDGVTNNGSASGSTSNSGLASAFRSSPLLSRAILYSDALQSAVNELYDVPGASIVQVSLSNKGIEFGTVGPRSECWVNVPYHRGQGGMYVGLECYKPNVPLFGVNANLGSDGNDIVRRYSLSAFLSGMRGLDIGVETCISVNARGMMAIQHQVDRDGYYNYSHDGDRNAKPSFVDFIMTCIEEDDEDVGDGGGLVSQDDASVREHNNGLHDITNTDSTDLEDVASRKNRDNVVRARNAAKSRKNDDSSSEEEEERPVRKTGRKGKKQHNDKPESEEEEFGGGEVDFDDDDREKHDDSQLPNKNKKNNATSRLLGELEMDADMLSSRRRGGTAKDTGRGRKNALEDIRRRRQEQQKQRQSLEQRDENELRKSAEQSEEDEDIDAGNTGRKSNDSNNSSGRKRRSETTSKAGASSRKTRRSAGEDDDNHHNAPNDDEDDNASNNGNSGYSRRHSNPAQDNQQSQSEDDDGDETENELDVTAEIPKIFSKRSSLSTSRHGSSFRTSASMDDGDGSDEEEQEPRMMYGDTKLEFTQDVYDSD